VTFQLKEMLSLAKDISNKIFPETCLNFSPVQRQ